MKVESYIQSQITKLNSQVAEYSAVKIQRDKLLDISTDLTNIKDSYYYILLDIEKISLVITDQLYYVSSSGKIILTGEVKDLKLLSIFMKNLEIEFKIKKN